MWRHEMRPRILLVLLFWTDCVVALFVPHESRSYSSLGGTLTLRFLNEQQLRAVVGSDVLNLGGIRANVEVAGINHLSSWTALDPRYHDGVFGFAPPTPDMPAPAFMSFAESGLLQQNVFSIWIDAKSDKGELFLGGVSDAAVEGVSYVDSLITCREGVCKHTHYVVPVSSIRFGDKELLEFVSPDTPPLHAIVDSGSSCIRLPNNTVDGALRSPPMLNFVTEWNALVGDTPSLKIEIGDRVIEVEASDYVTSQGTRMGFDVSEPCVTTLMAPSQHLLILGLPVFAAAVIAHDLSDPSVPRVGFARRNRYKHPPASAALENDGKSARIPMARYRQDFLFHLDLTLGTPEQGPLRVIVDTGSSTLAVFATSPPLHIAFVVMSILPGCLLVVACAVGGILCYCRRRKPPQHAATSYQRVETELEEM